MHAYFKNNKNHAVSTLNWFIFFCSPPLLICDVHDLQIFPKAHLPFPVSWICSLIQFQSAKTENTSWEQTLKNSYMVLWEVKQVAARSLEFTKEQIVEACVCLRRDCLKWIRPNPLEKSGWLKRRSPVFSGANTVSFVLCWQSVKEQQ